MVALATWNGEVVAEAQNYEVVENNVYFPEETVCQEYLEASDKTTACSWKGRASYYDVVVDGERNENAAWTYKEPKPAAKNVAGHIAFWNGVDVKKDVDPRTKDYAIVKTEDLYAAQTTRSDELLIDIRSSEDFEKHYIPGAISLPAAKTKYARDIFSKNRPLVLYGDGPKDKRLIEAAKQFQETGFKHVRLYSAGITTWKDLGNPFYKLKRS